MTQVAAAHSAGRRRSRRQRAARLAVIDIGSNSVRLVVYESARRVPAVLFNEKIMCGLGQRLQETGQLDPDGVKLALMNLSRFAELLENLGIDDVDVVATAAVRDATDGAAFVDAVAAESGLSVRVLSGDEEARLSALGAVAGGAEGDGVVADLGGGSLELVSISDGRVGARSSAPIGPLRLANLTGGKKSQIVRAIDNALAEVDWLADVKTAPLHLVGGSWRALARIHMAQSQHPVRIVHQYALPRDAARRVADLVAQQSGRSLARLEGVSRRRIDVLPLAAQVLGRLLRRLRPPLVTFSAFGLREGLVYSRLAGRDAAYDVLVDSAVDLAARAPRAAGTGDAIARWTTPLFADESAACRRMRLAACALCDVGWRFHPDYRAIQAFELVLLDPSLAACHEERVFVALATYCRYTGGDWPDSVQQVARILDDELAFQAQTIGLAARMALTLCGTASHLLNGFALELDDDAIVLTHDSIAASLIGEVTVRRFERLARHLKHKAAFRVRPPAEVA